MDDVPKPYSLPTFRQVTANVLCADGVHDTEVLAINAASAALAVSPLPWAGPIGAVRVAVGADGAARVGSSTGEEAAAAPRLRVLVAGTRSRIVLLEAEVCPLPASAQSDGCRACCSGNTTQSLFL
jgi:polyribonucleotide nucleotidyltransferase